MKNQINTFLIVLSILFVGCSSNREFPEVKNLSNYKNTEFAPTLEQKLKDDKNAVYSASLLFAWDELRNQIKDPIEIGNEYPDLMVLNQSESFQNVLKDDEYTVSAEIESAEIKVTAAFDKNLPFKFDLQSFTNKLIFDGQKVASFGVNGSDKYQMLESVRIIYYKNDNNFIIKLLPKDKNHEIVLFKSEKKFSTLIAMNNEIARCTKIGLSEEKNSKLYWKYRFEYEDELVIPKFNFNIETDYPVFENNKLTTKLDSYTIESVLQRTAFILDESGAKIESEATEETTSEEGIAEEDIKKPKKMLFDKPFLILLKRTDNKNPYFALWNANAELMTKE
ncbi:hypothetical protein [Flavobacterium tegetincola]|uniref:hypothetical protein n=1 Tax=Flavobacterium tegetincola TaxID=150172 RepID=UPI000401110E|nr:hypothetical protein [Flavobacterium tegetincola]